ncbi:GNAT family N-acetyltransferase [Streptomyces sp. 796.1]|uniref:GNAT family N-acetyltransferase n=1 Tax=Streptomyces sp. 796.1 TaxID=3163029 RepID=UPI0039C8DCAA
MTTTVTTWYLEQTAATDLSPARPPAPGSGVRVARAGVPSPELSRFLYTAVGGDNAWIDRLGWSYAQWQAFLGRPGVETWVAYEAGTPAGYVEMASTPDGSVELTYFGLLPAFRGRGIGGHLLSVGVARAWDLAERWPNLAPTRRVWLQTCSKDGAYALDNYKRRGFGVYKTLTTEEPEPVNPGPWAGAHEAPTSA